MASQPEHQTLGDRMKSYEAVYDASLPASVPAILRLDGHRFSRFTAHFARPFDQRIHDAMVSTCSDLLHFLPSATIAYTQSDEITLVFPSGVGSFNDRIQKIVGLSASYTSVRFNAHLTNAAAISPEPAIRNAANVLGTAYFDGRLFSVPSVGEALNCLLWRCRVDAVRNSVNAYARTLFTTKELHGKSTEEVLEMMKSEKGVIFKNAVPCWAIEGTIVKKELFEHYGLNQKTRETEKAMRTRTRAVDMGITGFTEQNLRLVTERYWQSTNGLEGNRNAGR